MERMMLVINPRSGKGLAPGARSVAERMAKARGIQLDVRTIAGPGDGKLLAEEAIALEYDRIISAGGDGTLNAVASGMLGSSLQLGVVALGSGNGYARSLGLPLKPEDALYRALTGEVRLMDIGYLNDMPFLGTAGIGFDARVAYRFDKSKSRGMFGYAKIIAQEILGTPPMDITLNVNGKRIQEKVLMVVFCNTQEFGNGAVISPGSLPDDGLGEVRIVRKPPFFPLIKAFYQIYTRNADRSVYIRNEVTTEATAHQSGTLAHLDGEPVEIGHEVRFRLEPKRLWVVG